MAKKKVGKKTEASSYAPRKESRSVSELEEHAEALRDIAGKLGAMAKEMTRENVASIDVDGVQRFARGVKLLKQFSTNVRMAIVRATPDK